MIELINELIRFLSQDDCSVESTIAKVGTIESDPGVPMPVNVKSKLSGIESASVSRYPDSGLPFTLMIKLSTSIRLSAEQLQKEFGNFHKAARDRGRKQELILYPQMGATSWKIVLIAEVADSNVSKIVFRRDPV